MEKEKYGFIYITTNNVNNMKYIGQKKYSVPNWKTYLGSGIRLKKAIKKYGRQNFTREIIDEAYSKEELNEKEKYWINYYDATKSESFYNIAQGGDGGFVVDGYSDEEYKIYEANRISRVIESNLKGEDAYNSKLTNLEVKDIINDLLNGAYYVDLANKYEVSISTIMDIAHHRSWMHLTDGIEFPNVSYHNRSVGKPVAQYDLNMNLIKVFDNARRASEETGIGYKLISRVCSGERKQTKGYIFKFI